MARDNKLYNGFVLHDYLLTFVIHDRGNRERLVELFRGAWQGDEVTPISIFLAGAGANGRPKRWVGKTMTAFKRHWIPMWLWTTLVRS